MRVCEIFRAAQGEGPEVGVPTTFVRLGGCNLKCSFCDSQYHNDYKEMSINELENILFNELDSTHITFTGGEPILQQPELSQLFDKLISEKYRFRSITTSLETNGTLITTLPFDNIVISPKKQAINDLVLKYYAELPNTSFKFVYENKKDLWWEDVIKRCNIQRSRVYIMPEGKTREEQIKKMPEVIEYCIQNKFKFSARIHVLAYDQKRGV